MSETLNDIDIRDVIAIALKAGKEILKFYNNEYAGESGREFTVKYKDDKSPLTSADTVANQIIIESLESLYPGIPLLSEEGVQVDFEIRKAWPVFWLVDPLDGTKEFLQKTGEFTVNIALVENQTPVLGVVYAPVKNLFYYAKKGEGAWKIENVLIGANFDDYTPLKIPGDRQKDKSNKKNIVVSRSHISPETTRFIESLFPGKGDYKLVSVGSSLKICLVAEGSADMYPRLGPTMEWDTAAGCAIALEAGKKINVIHGMEITCDELVYNKSSLVNPDFIIY